MFDLNPEDLWMGPKPSKKKRKQTYYPKQKQYSVNDYVKGAYGGAKATYKGAKTTYRGAKKTYGTVSKFVSKIGKKSMQDRTIREKLRGSIYKKEK